MALVLSKELESGVTGNYWKIASAVVLPDGKARAILELYVNRDSFLAGKKPLNVVVMDDLNVGTLVKDVIQPLVKNHAGMAGATESD